MRKKREMEGKTEEIRRKGRKEVVKEDEDESKNKTKKCCQLIDASSRPFFNLIPHFRN